MLMFVSDVLVEAVYFSVDPHMRCVFFLMEIILQTFLAGHPRNLLITTLFL